MASQFPERHGRQRRLAHALGGRELPHLRPWVHFATGNSSGCGRSPRAALRPRRGGADGVPRCAKTARSCSPATGPTTVFRWHPSSRLEVLATDPRGAVLAAPTNVVFTGTGRNDLVVPNLGHWHLTRRPLSSSACHCTIRHSRRSTSSVVEPVRRLVAAEHQVRDGAGGDLRPDDLLVGHRIDVGVTRALRIDPGAHAVGVRRLRPVAEVGHRPHGDHDPRLAGVDVSLDHPPGVLRLRAADRSRNRHQLRRRRRRRGARHDRQREAARRRLDRQGRGVRRRPAVGQSAPAIARRSRAPASNTQDVASSSTDTSYAVSGTSSSGVV